MSLSRSLPSWCSPVAAAQVQHRVPARRLRRAICRRSGCRTRRCGSRLPPANLIPNRVSGSRPVLAARLAGSATSYLRLFRSAGEVYVVVVQGHFAPQTGQSSSPRSLYLVLMADHSYLAHGLAASSIDLSRLGHFHSYVPELSVPGGLWGHTMMQGGPFPGGPRPITQAQVAIWKATASPPPDSPCCGCAPTRTASLSPTLCPVSTLSSWMPPTGLG